MFAQRFVFLLSHASSAFSIFGQKTVYHEVGVTADGTGKMGIVIECQSVVSDVLRAVASLHHGTQADGFNHVLFLLSLHIAQQFVQALGYVSP